MKKRRFNFKTFSEEELAFYDSFIEYLGLPKRAIKEEKVKYIPPIDETLKRCESCGQVYPNTEDFFILNKETDVKQPQCVFCGNKDIGFGCDNETNKDLYDIYRYFGIEVLSLYINKDDKYIIKAYNIYLYKTRKDKKPILPSLLDNEYCVMKIIKYLYDTNKINKYSISKTHIYKTHKIPTDKDYCSINRIYEYLFGDDIYNRPYNYPNYRFEQPPTMEQIKIIFHNYIRDNNIIIDDKYNFNYGLILRNAHGLNYYVDQLEFIVEYNNYDILPYKFISINYWKKKKNRIFAMKSFIEKDLKISIDKIPLYVSKANIRRNSTTLYSILTSKDCYSGDIFKWIDECYPDKFSRDDFNINMYKFDSDFDSLEEEILDTELRKYFKNIIYNKDIVINDMIPDWIAFKYDGCYLIEYFGMCRKDYGSKVIIDYNNRTEKKLEKYKTLVELANYKFIDLYPEDLNHKFKLLHEKLNKILI